MGLLMALFAQGLNFTAPVKDVRSCHHAFIVHMLDRPAVTVSTCDVLGDVIDNRIVLGEIDMTDQAQ